MFSIPKFNIIFPLYNPWQNPCFTNRTTRFPLESDRMLPKIQLLKPHLLKISTCFPQIQREDFKGSYSFDQKILMAKPNYAIEHN